MIRTFIGSVISVITNFINDLTLPKYLHLLPVGNHLNLLTCAYTVVGAVVVGLVYYYLWLPINWVNDIRKKSDKHFADGPRVRRRKGGEPVEQVEDKRLPPAYPNGWYAILETSDLNAGQVKHVQALGENFAVMRTAEGQIHVLDAYCPHLGANLAVGGVVKGDCLECPFHGWQFRGEDGHCTHIPYSDRVPKSAVVKKWTSCERNGFILVWYHAEGEPPSWQVETLPDIKSGKLWYKGRLEYILDATVQDFLENLADFAHLKILHKPSLLAGSDLTLMRRYLHRFLEHLTETTWTPHSSPEERHISTQTIQHSLSLFKFHVPIFLTSTISYGPGLISVHSSKLQAVATMTPLDPYTVKFVFRVYSTPSWYISGLLGTSVVKIMFERDAEVWKYKRYLTKLLLVKEDDALAKFKHWFKQFYSDSSLRFPIHRESLEW